MLAFLRLAADFSRGWADREISHLLFATHPYRLIRQLTLEDTLKLLIGLGLCRIAALVFRGCTLQALWCIRLRSMRLTPPGGIMDVVADLLKNHE
jgi:hypothetical protein